MAMYLQNICGERLRMLNMQTYYTIADYMIHNEYIMSKDVEAVYAKISSMDSGMKKDSVIFEMACFELGMITEQDLIDIIVRFRGVEVVLPSEIRTMEITYDSFSKELCEKHLFFEYVNKEGAQNIKYVVVSFTSAERINGFLRRSIADYRIRYSLPIYIQHAVENV